jgi:hypothetical protein
MRGGNRAYIRAAPGAAKAPPPPRDLDPGPPPPDLDPVQRRLWVELRPAVTALRVYRESDLTAFRQLVRVVARAEACPLDAAPSAAGRLEQAAASALASFGLTPLARERVTVPPAPPPEDELSEFVGRA